MTGGVAVILGKIGHNFGAGMNGGIAYVYDKNKHLETRIDSDSVSLQKRLTREDGLTLRALLREHVLRTQSPLATSILSDWPWHRRRFRAVLPKCHGEEPLSNLGTKQINLVSDQTADR